MACKICGGMCRPEYDTCYQCKLKNGEIKKDITPPLEQPKKKDDYSKGMKIGLAHNLTVQYLLSVMKEMGEDNLDTKQDYFWSTYDLVFETFKKKIDEKEVQ